MKIRIVASLYSIIIGIAMIGMWFVFIATDQVPEINTAPLQISYHLIAEFFTAIILLVGGFGLFNNKVWGFHLYLISMGMLFYTVIASAGYYADLGDIIMVGMFTVFQIFTIIFIVLTFYMHKEFKK
jgi:hypothetical protein